MTQDQIRIYYLYHSGFAIKVKEHLLIFDYYSDEPVEGGRGLNSGTISKEDLSTVNSIYVFVSHSHEDHYNPVIFDWEKSNNNIHYILSFDVDLSTRNPKYHSMQPYEDYRDDNITVKTYGSTDLGISFLVDVHGLKIFHAGDLNCWYWYDESTSEELEQAECSYLKELDRMKGESVDIAFFPVDPRLAEYYYMGGEYFIKRIKPGIFIPMHFGNDYSITNAFAHKVKSLSTRVVELSHRGQEIIYNKDQGESLAPEAF